MWKQNVLITVLAIIELVQSFRSPSKIYLLQASSYQDTSIFCHYGNIETTETEKSINSFALCNSRFVTFGLLGSMFGCISAFPRKVLASGVQSDGLFDNCPENLLLSSCVSSQDDRPQYFLAPWCYDGSYTSAKRKLLDQLLQISKAKILGNIDESPDRYISVLFPTDLGSDVYDETEFYFTPNDNTIQFRSLRRGNNVPDFGANRNRLEKLRIALNFESVPVLRNRRRVLFFVESPLDSFGPPTIQFERMIDSISGDMEDRAPYGVSAEKDPLFPTWEMKQGN